MIGSHLYCGSPVWRVLCRCCHVLRCSGMAMPGSSDGVHIQVQAGKCSICNSSALGRVSCFSSTHFFCLFRLRTGIPLTMPLHLPWRGCTEASVKDHLRGSWRCQQGTDACNLLFTFPWYAWHTTHTIIHKPSSISGSAQKMSCAHPRSALGRCQSVAGLTGEYHPTPWTPCGITGPWMNPNHPACTWLVHSPTSRAAALTCRPGMPPPLLLAGLLRLAHRFWWDAALHPPQRLEGGRPMHENTHQAAAETKELQRERTGCATQPCRIKHLCPCSERPS